MLASKRAWGPGISAARPSATRSRRLRYTVPRLTRGSRRRTRRWTDSAVGCASLPRRTSRTTRRGPVRRRPRARRAASEFFRNGSHYDVEPTCPPPACQAVRVPCWISYFTGPVAGLVNDQLVFLSQATGKHGDAYLAQIRCSVDGHPHKRYIDH